MAGYRMVFDRENLKLAWSRSDCEFPSLLIYIKDLFWYSQVHCGLPLCNVWNRLFHLELGCQQQFVCLVINIYLHDSFWRYAKVVKVDSSCWNAIQVGNETMTLLYCFFSVDVGQDLGDSKTMSLTSPPDGAPSNPLPTTEQQSTPGGRAVSPAVAGRAPAKPSAASTQLISSRFCLLRLLPELLLLLNIISAFKANTGIF